MDSVCPTKGGVPFSMIRLIECEVLTENHKNSMSTRGSRGAPLQGYVRNGRRRKMPLDVDLNVPPADNPSQEGTSADSNTLDVQNGQQRASVLPVPIDVEAFDDDVVISSPRAFAEVCFPVVYNLYCILCFYTIMGSLILLLTLHCNYFQSQIRLKTILEEVVRALF